MVNILPNETKLELKKNYFWRRRLVTTVSLLVVSVISLILGVTLFFIVKINQGGIGALLQKGSVSDETKNYEELVGELKKTSQMMKEVSVRETLPPSLVLTKVVELKGAGIKINDFELTSSSEGVRVAIKGKSFSRKSLTDFINNLKSSKVFVSVDSPLSNLINEGESDYSINLLLSTSTPR